MTGLAMPGLGYSQRTHRVWRVFTDQHGREFGAESDMATNQPIGELQPQGFQPPWQPPMRFAKWRRDGDLQFRWDYAALADELSGMTAQYYEDVTKFMIDHMPNDDVPDVGEPVPRKARNVLGVPLLSPAIPLACEAGDPWMLGIPNAIPNPMLKAVLEQHAGANGKEALDFIRAKLQRSLGERAVPLVPSSAPLASDRKAARSITDVPELPPVDPSAVTYKEFVGEALKRGMSMADAAMAWRDHKAFLAADAA